MQLTARLIEPSYIIGVDNPDYSIRVLVVMLPERSDLVLPTDVPDDLSKSGQEDELPMKTGSTTGSSQHNIVRRA